MISIIIPAWRELYLQETIDSIFKNATGEIEVIAVLDGYWPDPPLREDKRLHQIHRKRLGMRDSINNAVAIARGKYILKIDAHCTVAEGFDETLSKECDGDWIVIPRRYSLDFEGWKVRTHRPFVDYEYLGYPYSKKLVKDRRYRMAGWTWDARIAERCNILFDETMTFQGSCWIMQKEHFTKRIGNMDKTGYGSFLCEAQEIGLKTWLGGGKIFINKKTWYAHLWKGEVYRQKFKETYGDSYTRVSHHEMISGNKFTIDYWLNNRWEGRIHDFSWLLEKFWPVPSWPEEREKWTSLPT